ncbi:MAG: hypothetical protein IJJ01_11775 [Firmicutes bacterium]|nr:hypothetical protein [Clostridia bacterium]MBR0457333.1 hypothetical protein [Bacillota bacterium]
MTNKKNWGKLIIVLFLSVGVPVFLIQRALINIDSILIMGADFHFNMISMSAVIGGFLFTGISILISAISNERIQRLWDNNYLDNLYRAAFVGMIGNVLTIIVAIIYLCVLLPKETGIILIKIEIITIFIALVFFIWSIIYLVFIVTKMKND